jgi:hypothetical protein
MHSSSVETIHTDSMQERELAFPPRSSYWLIRASTPATMRFASARRQSRRRWRVRYHVTLERFTQERARAEEPRADGRGRNTEALRRFLYRHVFDFAHDEHGPECDRQFVDAAFDDAPDLTAPCRVRG